MVSQPEIIRTIAACLRRYQPRIIVVDPVMISKSGYPLLAPEACETLIKELLPLATLVTPNLPEAEAITGMQVTEKAQMRAVAEKIITLGAKAVLVKGGHLSDTADDLLFDGSTETWFPGKRIPTKILMAQAARFRAVWRQIWPRGWCCLRQYAPPRPTLPKPSSMALN